MIFMGDFTLFPSEQIEFLVFHMAQQNAAKPTPYTCLPFGRHHLIHGQNCMKEAGLAATPKERARVLHTYMYLQEIS
jgi:hypothetical protein